ncbi:UNVERIFIED_CONTAM: Polyadenylate-binding protein-interacting protein 4 [Sesamum radiatum]|uniref:Polyadenylate-binding protein-interacting protein 4 n=1 Tax=Sesamum radiatum TaxID=300843 RepID=A0AAW2KHC8_SESRA
MACRKGELREEGKSRSAAAAAAAPLVAVGDALLFTTMCIIGMPVDVHAKDGSVYSGIFHTASVDKDYAVVLKNAKMIKKGNLEANVVNGTLIETLIVQSNDLVQVVAKAGCSCFSQISSSALPYDWIQSEVRTSSTNKCLPTSRESYFLLMELRDTDEPDVGWRGRKGRNDLQTVILQQRGSGPTVTFLFAAKRENGFSHTNKPTIALGSSPEDHNERLDARKFVKIEVAHTLPVDGRQGGDGSPEMQSDTHNIPEFQDKGATNEVQGSRLSITTCEAQSAAAVNALEDTMQQEPKGLSLVLMHLRTNVKIAVGNGGSDASYVQPIIGQVVNRTPQPFRYTGQYQNFQASPAYGHPNVQNVMFGRGPVVCMHPISSDVVQSAAGFSPATARPLLTPHQVHLPKHQGTASAQALQLCMAPPILASGPQPFVMPSSIPIQQPLFPVLRPIAVPGANGFLSTKFA